MPRRLLLSLLVACLAAASPAAARERWLWPVRGPVVGRFAVGPDRFAAGQRRGIDIAAPLGAPVRAACSGRVSFTGAVGASGRVVAVACGPLSATYLHLGQAAVRRGEFVGVGEPIGTVGTSGRPREPMSHVSLGARVRARARGEGYVDPLRLLGADPPGAPRALPARRVTPPEPGPAPALAPLAVPAGLPAPLVLPARTLMPGAATAPAPVSGAAPVPVARPGLPLGGLWLPAGFGLLIGAFTLTAARRIRADLGGARRAGRRAWRESIRVATRR